MKTATETFLAVGLLALKASGRLALAVLRKLAPSRLRKLAARVHYA